MTRPFLLIPLLAALLGSSCGRKSAPAGPTGDAPPPPAADGESGDMALGLAWVKTMLEENDEKLAKMREDLEVLRRELDRTEASAAQDRLDQVKQGMIEILDKQERELRDLNSQADEMRKAMDGNSP